MSNLFICGKVVDISTGEIFALKVGSTGKYTVLVTEEKAKEIGVEDADIAKYMDVPILDAVKIGEDRCAFVENSIAYMKDFSSVPSDKLGENDVYWGYVFKPYSAVTLDSDTAIQRMIACSTKEGESLYE